MIGKGVLKTYIFAAFICPAAFGAGTEPNLASCEQNIKKTCNTITVFITGNELGELRPCGCSGGQLGGFDRRSTILKTVNPQQRMLIDTGNFIQKQDEQSLIKLDIMMQAFLMLGYDVLNLTEQDLSNLGQIEGSQLNFITALPQAGLKQSFAKKFQLGSKSVQVIVSAAQSHDDANLLPGRTDTEAKSFRIVIFNAGQNEAEKHLSELENANIVVAQSDSDEPGILLKPQKGPMLVSAGKLGKYVGRLDISLSQNGEEFVFSYKSVAVSENISQDPAFLELYKSYQAIVKNQNLLKNYPRYVLPGDLAYVGSTACGLAGCHDYEYKTAMTQKHAIAFESLVLVGSDYDPECVVCHSVGMEYKGGFITENNTPELKDVGCESCHGPGSKHIVTAGKAKTTGPKMKCLDCHTAEQSANYAGQKAQYCEKIFHWKEPNALDCVQY